MRISILLLLICNLCYARQRDLLLIPGLGFDKSVFDDFIQRNQKNYRMYPVTLAGFGDTPPPLIPDSAHASYGLQAWTNHAVDEIVRIIKKKHLLKPFVVGHFVLGAQIALRLAVDYPDLVGGVIVIGAPAKFIPIVNGAVAEYPLPATIKYIDKYTGPQWFGTMSKEKFDQGNYLPEIYSLTPDVGRSLWNMSASVPMPVYVRYLCEFFASDITLEMEKVTCPVFILRSMFTPAILNVDVNNYVKPQFIDSWDRAAKVSPKVIIKDMLNTASFIWKDQPAEFDKLISAILRE